MRAHRERRVVSTHSLSRREIVALVVVVAVFAGWLLMPVIRQS